MVTAASPSMSLLFASFLPRGQVCVINLTPLRNETPMAKNFDLQFEMRNTR